MINMLQLLFGRSNKASGKIFNFNQKRKLSTLVQKEEHDRRKSKEPVNFRNKSGLRDNHRNVIHNERPYKEPQSWIHLSERYQRTMFGRYGSASGVNPRICFSIKTDKSIEDYERFVENNETVQSMINKHQMEKELENQKILQREEDISKKLGKLSQWKSELNAKVAKKEADANAAKEKKDRLVEEVRRHFGYKIDPKDERFKEVLEQKEKEDKKKRKEAKRKDKEQKLMSMLVGSSVTTKV